MLSHCLGSGRPGDHCHSPPPQFVAEGFYLEGGRFFSHAMTMILSIIHGHLQTADSISNCVVVAAAKPSKCDDGASPLNGAGTVGPASFLV